MDSQREWNALETKYATPPVPEDRRAKTRRKANRAQARSRLQKRQVRRRIEAQEAAAVAVGALPHVELTQAEEAVLASRYSTPPIEESADARRLRLNNRRRAEVKLQRRSTSRRLQITADAPDPAHMSEAVESFAVGDHALPGTTASAVPIPSVVREPPSYEQLAAAVLNLASEAVSTQEDGNELPTRTQLITALRNLTPDDADSTGLPTYEDLAAALRTFAPTESRQNDVGRDGPSYAQLNAALRNLSPGLLSQDQPADGFPTYTQLSEALRNLTPTPSSATDNLSGFPTYAQLAEALRRLPSETAPVRSSRHSGGQYCAALGTMSECLSVPRHVLPEQAVRCGHCGAMLWRLELQNACCLNGDVTLAPSELPHPRIRELYNTRSFLEKIRGYNSAFAFTSTGAKEDYLINRGNAPYTFRINGSMHHRIGQLLPPEGATPTFAQIYMYDGSTEDEVALRGLAISSGLNHVILGELQTILHDINPLAAVYQSAREHANESQEVCLVLLDNPRVDPRRYNKPTANEVAALMAGGPTASHRDVVLRYRRGGLRRIFETHPLYDPLQYPLIYLRGELGWSIHARYVEGVQRNNNSKVSLREHTAFRLYMKHEDVEYSLPHSLPLNATVVRRPGS